MKERPVQPQQEDTNSSRRVAAVDETRLFNTLHQLIQLDMDEGYSSVL